MEHAAAFDWMQMISILPEAILVLSAMMILMVGAYGGPRATGLTHLLASLALVAACYVLVAMPSAPATILSGMLKINAFTQFTKLLILIGTLLVLAMAGEWQRANQCWQFEWPVLKLLAAAGMCLMVSANNLISLYMALELMSLSLYVMASFRRDDVKSSEAGLKYFLLGALSSGMMLFGASLVYGFAGGADFAALATLFAANPVASMGVLVGLILVMVGFCFKISAVPFHMWTPDVYEGAPTPVTAFFAAAPKVAALALFTRVLLEPFGPLVGQWQQVVIVISVLSMLLGAFAAITQTNVKRLLAYSSIGHVGYVLVGLASATVGGVQAILIYLSLYIFMSIGAFACVLQMRRGGQYVEHISDLAGLSKRQPWLAGLLALFMFSMAGIPPLAGFFGKMYIFLAALHVGLVNLAVIGVLTSVVACYYYLKVVKIMYFDDTDNTLDAVMAPAMRVVLALTGLVTLCFFLYPAPLVSAAQAAASALFP